VITRVARSEAAETPLPGRTWYSYISPEPGVVHNVSMGVSVFPPGSRPKGHVHDSQEETIYVASGHGRLVTPDGTAQLEPGVVVLVGPGTFHSTEADAGEPLELVCLFAPPVVPGSYEKPDDA
jgi:quercetin dioxygenase-like cupin family protein